MFARNTRNILHLICDVCEKEIHLRLANLAIFVKWSWVATGQIHAMLKSDAWYRCLMSHRKLIAANSGAELYVCFLVSCGVFSLLLF